MTGPDIQLTTLPNGLRVATDRAPSLHSAALGLWVAAGARHEDVAAEGGIAHLTEHMLFKGTPTRTALDISESLEAVGGRMNAYTGREITAYHAHVLEGDVRLALDVLTDILRRSTVPDEELERERGVVLAEIGMSVDTPDDRVFDHVQEAAWPGQALGAAILGTAERISAMTRGQILGYIARAYRPERIVLSAAGAVEHDAIVALAQEMLGDMEGRGEAAPALPVRATYAGGVVSEARDLEQAHVVLGFAAVARTDPDYFAARVLCSILGGGMASRLFQEVREKRGLAYTVSSFVSPYRDGGFFGIYAGTAPGDLAELMPVLCGEIARLAGSLTDAEIDRARTQMTAGLLMGRENMAARADMAARSLIFRDELVDVEALRAQIAAVDRAALVRVAGRIFSTRPSVGALGPGSALTAAEIEGTDWAGRIAA